MLLICNPHLHRLTLLCLRMLCLLRLLCLELLLLMKMLLVLLLKMLLLQMLLKLLLLWCLQLALGHVCRHGTPELEWLWAWRSNPLTNQRVDLRWTSDTEISSPSCTSNVSVGHHHQNNRRS